jgi:integrase
MQMWKIEPTSVLSRRELAAVVAHLRVRAARSPNARLNLVLVRLACCAGLRASEIGGLRIGDVHVGNERPHLRVRAETAKGGRARRVPLWWDRGTLEDLRAWKAERERQAGAEEAFVCSLNRHTLGVPLNRHVIRRRFHTACKALGSQRTGELTVHHGRHTFISHALAGGRTLAEVRDAAGHSNISITSAYLHIVAEDGDQVGELFG